MSLPVRGAWIEMIRLVLLQLPLSSLPVRGAWIEIALQRSASLPSRGAWIEIGYARTGRRPGGESLPVRGAWIEIGILCNFTPVCGVAPRKGSVD